MPADLFDTQEPIILDHQIFIGYKLSYYNLNGKTENMTGAQVMVLFNVADN